MRAWIWMVMAGAGMPALAGEPAQAEGEAPQLGAWALPGAEDFTCSDGEEPPVLVEVEDIEAAEPADPLSRDQVRWLKPKLARLPQNPRAEKDYTAYTLEPGEVEVGLMTTAGVLSNVQIGTNMVLDGFGVYNAQLKVNAVREGPLDMALIGSRYQLIQDRYTASFTGVGAVASVQVVGPWSIHLGGDYYALKSTGLVDLDAISPYLSGSVDEAVDSISEEGYDDLDIFASVVRVRGATDVRFNRRDSVVLQFSAFVHAQLQTELPDLDFIPDIANIQEALSYDGFVPMSETYTTSLAWQFRWKRAELRVGGGLSSVPGAWLMQSTEFSYKLGGETRRSEARMRRTWRHNKRDSQAWAPGAIVEVGAADNIGPVEEPALAE